MGENACRENLMAAQFDSLKGSSLVPKNEQSVEAHILLYLLSLLSGNSPASNHASLNRRHCTDAPAA